MAFRSYGHVLAPFTKLARQIKERGFKGTLLQLYTVGDLKFGELKGVDKNGNKYYEDLSLPYGQHRWVEYADIHNPDPNSIHPEWHGWAHHVVDEVPGQAVGNPDYYSAEPSALNSDAAYNTHVGYTNEYDAKPHYNTTLYRNRQYGEDAMYYKSGDKEAYYLQPGHALSPDSTKGGKFDHVLDLAAQFDTNKALAELKASRKK